MHNSCGTWLSYSYTGLLGPKESRRLRLQEFLDNQHMKPYTQAAFTSQETALVLISLRGCVSLRAIVNSHTLREEYSLRELGTKCWRKGTVHAIC